jgi:hypothetical protein
MMLLVAAFLFSYAAGRPALSLPLEMDDRFFTREILLPFILSFSVDSITGLLMFYASSINIQK